MACMNFWVDPSLSRGSLLRKEAPLFWFWRKRAKWISVVPKNYRSIALYAINKIEKPEVLLDGKKVLDFSDRGPLTQTGLSECRNFEIRNSKQEVLGFHDHPKEMWVSDTYSHIAKHCEEQGWLKIEHKTS